MPQKADLTWQMKVKIWDLAAKLGSKPTAIQRSLERFQEAGELKEDIPDVRRIGAIIAELQRLPARVVPTLPQHVQRLRVDYAKLGLETPAQPSPLGGGDAQPMQAHRQILMSTLLDLREIEVFPLHHYDLALWYSRLEVPCWPIAKGQVCRDADGNLTVHLAAESKLEWSYLQQHLSDDPLWAAINLWKEAMASDVAARLDLLHAMIERIKKPAADGGIGLPVSPDMEEPPRTTDPAVSMRYAFAIYDQVLSRSLSLRYAPVTSGLFTRVHDPNILHLGDGPVISSPHQAQREALKEFLLQAQREWVSLQEVKDAAEAYQRAEALTREVKGHVETLRLAVAFPQGSTCGGCAAWRRKSPEV